MLAAVFSSISQGDPMNKDTVLLFTRKGLGDAPKVLGRRLAEKYLNLTIESGDLPAKILFYTEGMRLACIGSPVLNAFRILETSGVEIVVCQTCLKYFDLEPEVQVGVVGGMSDMLEALQKAEKVISV
jgi:predicted peroxiredoxin